MTKHLPITDRSLLCATIYTPPAAKLPYLAVVLIDHEVVFVDQASDMEDARTRLAGFFRSMEGSGALPLA